MVGTAYIGRFAPSPTGPLHAGSLVAALASYLDAKAHQGQWLLRIEDVDTPRCKPVYADEIIRQLYACGLRPDAEIVYQSQRHTLYQSALDTLIHAGQVYPCSCSRKDVAAHPRYPGHCRHGPLKPHAPQFAWRVHTQGEVERETGDFVLKRADGLWAYQLAVVVDDAAQGVTHVVRGLDLEDNTARQRFLQTLLNLPQPDYLHTPLVLAENGHKLSKQNHAPALCVSSPAQARQAMEDAASILGLPPAPTPIETDHTQTLAYWIQAWPIALQSALREKRFTQSPSH